MIIPTNEGINSPKVQNKNFFKIRTCLLLYIRYKEETTYNVLPETEDDCVYIHDCLPTKTYEFIIVSVSDNFERESDPQEIKMPDLSEYKYLDYISICILKSRTKQN